MHKNVAAKYFFEVIHKNRSETLQNLGFAAFAATTNIVRYKIQYLTILVVAAKAAKVCFCNVSLQFLCITSKKHSAATKTHLFLCINEKNYKLRSFFLVSCSDLNLWFCENKLVNQDFTLITLASRIF